MGKGSEAVGRVGPAPMRVADDAPALSSAALLGLGVLGGVYLLYTIGWIVAGVRLIGDSPGLGVGSDAMVNVAIWFAVAAPALWFGCSWYLTRDARTWTRWTALIVGAVLLVPWPFVMSGASGT